MSSKPKVVICGGGLAGKYIATQLDNVSSYSNNISPLTHFIQYYLTHYSFYMLRIKDC